MCSAELKQRHTAPEKAYFYLDKILDAHLLPLTNVAFNKLGTV